MLALKTFLQRLNFAKMMSDSSIMKQKSQICGISENNCSDVHRLHLGKNTDSENEKIEIHLLEMKEATFYLHDWMIAEENKKETFSADVLSLRQDLQNFCNSLNSLVLCNGLVIEAKTVFYIFLSRRITKHLKHYISYTAHMIKY